MSLSNNKLSPVLFLHGNVDVNNDVCFLINFQDCEGSPLSFFLSHVSPSAHHRKNKVYLLLPSCCFDKVPDPHNSHIFREMQYQVRDLPNTRCCLSCVCCSLIS